VFQIYVILLCAGYKFIYIYMICLMSPIRTKLVSRNLLQYTVIIKLYFVSFDNVQISYITLQRGFAQTVRVSSYGGGGWPNRHISFIVAEKA